MTTEKIPVVIFCGGRGARFDADTLETPKPLIEVAGKPILGHIMDMCEAQGYDEFIIAGGYLCEKLVEYVKTRYECSATPDKYPYITVFGNKGKKVKTHVFDTGLESTTGDRLMKLALDFMPRGQFILTYGDGLSDVDLDALVAHHDKMADRVDDNIVTVTAVHPPGRFGIMQFEQDAWHEIDGNFVTSFSEKEHGNDWINGGFMVVDPGIVIEYVPTPGWKELDEPCESFESGALPRLAKAARLAAFRHDGYWQCMDTRRDREHIEQQVKDNDGKLPWIR